MFSFDDTNNGELPVPVLILALLGGGMIITKLDTPNDGDEDDDDEGDSDNKSNRKAIPMIMMTILVVNISGDDIVDLVVDVDTNGSGIPYCIFRSFRVLLWVFLLKSLSLLLFLRSLLGIIIIHFFQVDSVETIG